MKPSVSSRDRNMFAVGSSIQDVKISLSDGTGHIGTKVPDPPA
jgi:hypothetical protein